MMEETKICSICCEPIDDDDYDQNPDGEYAHRHCLDMELGSEAEENEE
jgi:hypothetical protein